jgi:hypothetical protein
MADETRKLLKSFGVTVTDLEAETEKMAGVRIHRVARILQE